MILQNLDLAQAVELPADLLWTDEHQWTATVADMGYSLTGALLIQTGQRRAGRPITLSSPSDDMAWVRREVLDTLLAWAQLDPAMSLDLGRGQPPRPVRWRHADGAIEARPAIGFGAFGLDEVFTVTLRFMEIP